MAGGSRRRNLHATARGIAACSRRTTVTGPVQSDSRVCAVIRRADTPADTEGVQAVNGLGASVVLASDQYKWFWWIAPILVLSVLAVIGLLSGGYIRKVLIPRTKGRRVE